MNLMTHAVLGYPTIEKSMEIMLQQVDAGADYLEIQLPFSDPLGDGKIIMSACVQAIAQGISIKDCFSLINIMSKKITVPIILMTYCNLPYRYGYRNFICDCINSGVSAIIVPDLPYDELHENLYTLASERRLPTIPVVSPNIKENRLKMLSSVANYLLYCTFKVGVTGTAPHKTGTLEKFFLKIRQTIGIPLLGGFGIKSVQDARSVKHYVDTVVIGSQLIFLYNEGGLCALRKFISEIKQE